MNGVELIAQERARQIAVEGWTPEHDDQHDMGELAEAAGCYALSPWITPPHHVFYWPWASKWWRPAKDESSAERIRELSKAGALIAAEIDRLQRPEAKSE